MTIGDRIKCKREELHIGQTELAKSVKISKQTLYKYENNIITNIPSDKIENIAKVLGCTPAYLMGWDGKEDSKETRYEHSMGVFHVASDLRALENAKLLEAFDKLNDAGKEEAIKRVQELAEIERYRKRPRAQFSVAGSARRAAAAQLAKLGEVEIHTKDFTQSIPVVITADPTGISPSTVISAKTGPVYRNPRKPPISSANQAAKNEAKSAAKRQ